VAASQHGFREQLARRQFLQGTGAALAAGATGFADPRGAASEERPDTAGTSNGFQETGIWYFYPSIFEYSLGPWQPTLPARPDLVQLWKQTLNWFADQGLSWIVLHCAPYGGEANPSPIKADRVRFGWGYHYTLDFQKYPEAKTFDGDFVKRNQDIVRAITDYGKQKGVDVYFHHYNFFCTQPFLAAHPELKRMEFLRPGNFVEINTPDGWDVNTGNELTYDACWNKPLYRELLVSCWEEFFELFPSTAGMLMTPGERARCRCLHCIGEHPDKETTATARYGDSPAKRRTLASFCQTFYDTMRRLGKRPLIRSWIAGILDAPDEWARLLPKGPIYVTKYSVFDMIDTGVDPLAKAFVDAGHETWLMKEYVGSENAGPVVMTVPRAFDQIARHCRDFGAKVVMGVDNGEHGFTYKSRRVQYLPELLWANSFGRKRRGDSEQLATQYYTRLFGPVGSQVLRAVERYSELPYQIARLMWEHTEGFTWKFPIPFSQIGDASLTSPEWARREIRPFAQYIDYLKTHAWDETFRARITGDGVDPLAFLEQLTESAKEGWDELVRLAPQIPHGAKDDAGLLVSSAELTYLTGKRFGHFWRARLYAAGAASGADASVRQDLAKRAVAEFAQGIEATQQLQPILRAIPATMGDPRLVAGFYDGEEKMRLREIEELRTQLGVPGPAVDPPG
jgi:hypothetical protein